MKTYPNPYRVIAKLFVFACLLTLPLHSQAQWTSTTSPTYLLTGDTVGIGTPNTGLQGVLNVMGLTNTITLTPPAPTAAIPGANPTPIFTQLTFMLPEEETLGSLGSGINGLTSNTIPPKPNWSFKANAISTGQGKSLEIRSHQGGPLLIKSFGKVGQIKVGIGTSYIPSNFMLAVNGKIIAEELKVELSDFWPDYVFEKEHKLLSIRELEDFITTHKHLPNVPSKHEVEKEGVLVGEMQRVTMEKVEELVLYIIEQNKRIEELESKLIELESR